jgi:lipopolysaccharide export system permease protein
MISAYLACIFIFLFLYIIIDLFSHLDEILKERIGLWPLINYYLSFIPLMFIQVSPMACLLSMLYSIGGLSRNNEIIAMRSSGLSIWGITRPLIIFGLVVSVFVFVVNERLLPKTQNINYQIKKQMFKKDLKEENQIYNLAVYGQNNRHFFIDIYYPKKKMMENVVILEHDENQNVISKTIAKEAYFRENRWLFRKCLIYYFDKQGNLLGEPFYFENKFMYLKDKPEDFLRQQKKIMFMNIAQLKNYIDRLSTSGASAVLRNLKVDLYNRFTYPFTSLIIILVGIPFALGAEKRGRVISSLALCIGISFLYYIFNQTIFALGKLGLITPFLSSNLSHAIFLLFSLISIKNLP